MAMIPMEEEVKPTLVGLKNTEIAGSAITTYNGSWTATKDCYCAGYFTRGATNSSAYVNLTNVTMGIVGGAAGNANITAGVAFPVKKGQTVSAHGASDSSWNVRFYELNDAVS